MDANELEPLIPDRDGVRTSWFTSRLLKLKFLRALPGFIANRPSV